MNPGLYKDRITFVSLIENTDDIGGAEVTTSDLIKVWANVRMLTSSQQLQYGQVTTAKGYEIECRNLDQYTITEDNGITYGSKLLAIHSVVKEDYRYFIIAFEQ